MYSKFHNQQNHSRKKRIVFARLKLDFISYSEICFRGSKNVKSGFEEIQEQDTSLKNILEHY